MPKSAQTITSLFKSVPIDEQSSLLNALGKLHFRAKAERLKALKAETATLEKAKIGWEDTRTFFKRTRRKPQPTHRSRKDKSLTWSGRGSMPRWMREEMRALKLKPDAFLIAKRGR
jgi:DNA-binding protein H-NS